MKLDMNRLEKVLAGRYAGVRRAGHTTARAYEALTSPDSEVYVVLARLDTAQSVTQTVMNVAEALGIPAERRSRRLITTPDVNIHFISPDRQLLDDIPMGLDDQYLPPEVGRLPGCRELVYIR